jgi:hypothetical protein
VVKRHISNSRYRFRPLHTTQLVVNRIYFIVVPRQLPAAPLVVRRRYLIMVPMSLPAALHRYLIVVQKKL